MASLSVSVSKVNAFLKKNKMESAWEEFCSDWALVRTRKPSDKDIECVKMYINKKLTFPELMKKTGHTNKQSIRTLIGRAVDFF